ncbi:metallophosphoesterase [Sphingobacterium sp. SGG-5]|uniref:metallophosphoesterase family protein n=1 Tax=Sphingobacterium sp. SGG-5 TaxID=2710881 RepID=UPI0013E9FA38|nr:metallophosphoesterase [Sphingobacterium sp. SGG-5]NGM60653.1 metallophosphoesterase [Sphingobacterium sp. SGG-5]
MKRFILILFVFISEYSLVQANRVVYPWRACPAIVLVGQTIDILYDNTTDMPVDSVILEGPYNRMVLSVDSVRKGWFEYDTFTKAVVNNKIRITIPEGTPEELYDLIIKSNGETNISKRSVKVLKTYRNPHRFIHISDPHVSRQWVGSPENGYAKELELLDRFIEVANIIHPEYIIVTGDIIHDYTRFDADSLGWGGTVRSGFKNPPLAEEKYKNFFEGAHGFSGAYGFDAPVFSIPGNHDFYGPKADDFPAKAAQWNRLMGKRTYGFSYLDTRIIASDDYLGDPRIDIPDKAPLSGLQGILLESFLNTAGPGKIRILAQHRHNRVDTAFINRHKINVVLNGHSHRPREALVGTTPTLSIRPGAVCRSGEIANWKKTLGFFRVFTIDGDTFTYSKPLRFCKNPTAAYEELIMNLTLNFKKSNMGESTSNEALISNGFDVDLPNCNVRFVMAKGKYKISEGVVYQIIETSKFSVLDVRVDVEALSNKKIKITRQF